MRSISSRITAWYAFTSTATLACLFVVGYFLLESHLIRQLDQLNAAQFKELRARLGPEYKTLTPATIEERIRDTTEAGTALFYIDMHATKSNRFFKSSNLRGHAIPDIGGSKAFVAEVPDIGLLRIEEFLLPPYDVMVGTPVAPVYEVMDSYFEVCGALLLVMLLFGVAIGFALSQMVLRPVRAMSETANRIRSDNLQERIPVEHVRDELSQLAELLNQMFDRLETSFDQVRRFTAEASHELKTPLSLVRLHAEKLLMGEALGPAQRESVHVQLEELARVNQIIEELLFLSRADAQAITLESRAQRATTFLQGFAQDASALSEHHGRKFTYAHEGDDTVAFEEKRIRQVLLNLLSNALNASPPGGRITLHSAVRDGLWRVSVEDEGPGLTEAQRHRLFERFVRFNVPGSEDKGSGLGLAICRSIIQLHGGRIFASPGESGRGLRMVFEIPAQAA